MINNILKTTKGSKYFLLLIALQILSHNFIFFNLIVKNTYYLAIIIIVFLFSIFYKDFYFEAIKINFKEIKIKNFLISLLVFSPLILFYIKIYNADFNWGGDHRDNILFSLVNTKFWLTQIFSDKISDPLSIKYIILNFYSSRIFILISLFFITLYLYKKDYGNLANIILLIVIYFWSTYEIIPRSFGIKDPHGTNFINIFSNLFFYLFDLNLLDSLRLTNLISIFLWATILRPIFLNESLNLKILPFIIFYAWYPQFIYLQVGASNEPWSIIFLFLAMESLFKYRFDKIFLTIIFLCIGSCFKSQISLFIPILTFFYLLEKVNLSKKISLIFLSSLALFNTSSFSYIREKIYNSWQPIKIQNYGFKHLDKDFFDLVILRLSELYSLLIIFLLCLFILLKNYQKNKKIVLHLGTLLIFIFSILFFNTLGQFIQHTLYLRYYVYLFIIILSFVFLETYKNQKLFNILIIIFTIFVYSKDLYKYFNFNKETTYKLNFSQFDSDPLYLGLNQIINISEEDLKNKNIQDIYLSRSTQIIYKIPKYLFKNYNILASSKNDILCDCNNEKIAIINFYPKLRNSLLKFKTSMPNWPEGYNQLYGKNLNDSKTKCLEKIKDTCSIVHLLKEEDDTIIAVLGIN